MRVDWDPAKARANQMKHGVRFSDAEGVLFDPLAISREDVTSISERRFVTIGTDHLDRIVVVVYAQKERLHYAERI